MATPRQSRKRLGFRGEEIACIYLEGLGFAIADRNWRAGSLELDIIARRGNAAHAVEVKTRYPSQALALDELVSGRQMQRLVNAADAYAQSYDWVGSMQIDVILVVMLGRNEHSVEYFPDAITPPFYGS